MNLSPIVLPYVRWIRLLTCALLITTASACTTLPVEPRAQPSERVFSHEDLDSFLLRHVDSDGRVNYRQALGDREDLNRYIATLSAVSPDTDPSHFPTASHRLAYWLNAYNAWVIHTVLTHYPIGGVREVRPVGLHLLFPKGTGFFVLQRITLGGHRTSLYFLENQVIRKRFADPRVHFALNCASLGCPRLPAVAFSGEALEAELEAESRRFMAEARNLQIDLEERVVHLSSIFKWYEEDFSSRRGGLLDYVARYSSPEQSARLQACRSCEIAWIPYDWTLNDNDS